MILDNIIKTIISGKTDNRLKTNLKLCTVGLTHWKNLRALETISSVMSLSNKCFIPRMFLLSLFPLSSCKEAVKMFSYGVRLLNLVTG